MEAALKQADTFHNRLQEKDAEKMKLEQMIQDIQRESDEAKKALEESLKNCSREHCSLELISRYAMIKLFL